MSTRQNQRVRVDATADLVLRENQDERSGGTLFYRVRDFSEGYSW